MNVDADVTFVDSNVLVYAYDADAGWKHEVARAEREDLVLAALVIVPFVGYAIIFLFSGWDSVAQHVGGHVGVSQPDLLEVRQQLLQHRVREAFLIGEVHGAEHAAQSQVGVFNGGEGVV